MSEATDKALADAIVDLCWKATPLGETADGDTHAYILPKGTVHRLIGAAQCAGLPASFRAPGVPVDVLDKHAGEQTQGGEGW